MYVVVLCHANSQLLLRVNAYTLDLHISREPAMYLSYVCDRTVGEMAIEMYHSLILYQQYWKSYTLATEL